MQIILLEKIANVGNLGDVVKVKDGFARNFLIPAGQGQARHAATTSRRSRRGAPTSKAAADDRLAAAQALAAKLEGRTSRSRRRQASTAGCSARSPTSISPRR